MLVNEVYEGDCLDVMRGFPDNCIDSIVTDPPYALTNRTPDVMRCVDCRRILGGNDGRPDKCPRCGGKLSNQRSQQKRGFMGKVWDNGDIAFNPEVWREALRIAKPGATLLAFGGSRTYHRLVCAIEDAGWEIRDCIMWVYGSGFPKSHDVSKGIDKAAGAEREVVGTKFYGPDGKERTGGRLNGNYSSSDYGEFNSIPTITAPASPLAAKFNGYGTALKPAHEPIVLAMKPIDGTFAANAERWGVAGLNIDGGRVGYQSNNDFNKSARFGHSEKVSNANILNAKPPMHAEPNTNGRFPANVIHDGSEEVMAEFDKAGVRKTGGRKRHKNSPGGCFGVGGQAGEIHGYIDNNDSAARFFQQCPPDPTAHPEAARFRYCPKAGKRERGNGNNHPTVKPLSLLRYLAKLTRPPDGGIVLDPFGGSGTTALACIAEGRDYIIIEKEPEYAELCRRRIAEYSGKEIAPVEVKVESDVVKQMSLW